MSDLPKPEGGRVRLVLLSGLALLAVAATAAVMLMIGRLQLAPPPAMPPPAAPDRPVPALAPAAAPSPALSPAPSPAPAPPPSAALAHPAPRSDPDAWPADPADRLRAIQRLLGTLRLIDEPPNGQPGPATEAAIRDYQRMAGLEETGQPSEALFDSLKQVAAMAFPKPARP